jgi:hypothetical protein
MDTKKKTPDTPLPPSTKKKKHPKTKKSPYKHIPSSRFEPVTLSFTTCTQQYEVPKPTKKRKQIMMNISTTTVWNGIKSHAPK